MNAYSKDLRKKILEALGRATTKSEAARAFGVSRSSVKRYAKLVEHGRPLTPKKRPGSKPKIDQRARRLLEANLEERPTTTALRAARVSAQRGRSLGERVHYLADAQAPEMEPKKRSLRARERDESLRDA